MENTRKKIQTYIKNVSRGTILFSDKVLDTIIDIVRNDGIQPITMTTVNVRRYKYDPMATEYLFEKEFKMPTEQVTAKIESLANASQYKYAYRFRIIDLDFEFFSLNKNLFKNGE